MVAAVTACPEPTRRGRAMMWCVCCRMLCWMAFPCRLSTTRPAVFLALPGENDISKSALFDVCARLISDWQISSSVGFQPRCAEKLGGGAFRIIYYICCIMTDRFDDIKRNCAALNLYPKGVTWSRAIFVCCAV